MIGTIVVWLGLAAAAYSALAYYRLATRKAYDVSVARRSFFLSVASVVTASVLLMAFIIQHKYEYAYVWSYSGNSLPFQLLITTFWAGQEGSFLFWTLCAVIIGILLRSYTQEKKIEYEVMSVYMLIVSFLLVLLSAKSPFKYVWESFPDQLKPGTIPTDGRGLNPLLQNIWMIVHPPVLFIGFASIAVPFAFAISALWRKRFNEWILPAIPWVIFSVLSLGAGLILGGYWAYGVLGWGGWWGWDPVENSSLIPWIVVMTLLHTLIVQLRTGKLARTNFILAIVSFLLVVYSTFLTRSGILGESSVHSFVDPGTFVYTLLIIWMIAMAGIGSIMLSKRWNDLKTIAVSVGNWTRESFLSMGAIAMALVALVILVGTSWPIFSKATVEPSFYDKTILPFAIILSLILGLSLFTRWGEEKSKQVGRRSILPMILALAGTIALGMFGVSDWQMLALAFSALFVVAISIHLLVVLARENPRVVGGPLAHLGLAILLLGIIGSGRYGQKVPVSLRVNQPESVLGYELTYKGSMRIDDAKTQYNVEVKKGNTVFTLQPVTFISTYNNGVMRTPDYASSLTEDVYIEAVSVDRVSAGQSGHNHSILELKKGIPQTIGGAKVTFEKFDMSSHSSEGMADGKGFAIGAVLQIEKGGKKETVVPVTSYGGQAPAPKEAKLKDGSMGFQMFGMQVGSGGNPSTVQVNVTGLPNSEPLPQEAETLTVEASVKPFMNFVWLGAGLVMVGFLVSLVRRSREQVEASRPVEKHKRNGKKDTERTILSEVKVEPTPTEVTLTEQ
jgi:cytochrome c-type biogenesis protein CcmF